MIRQSAGEDLAGDGVVPLDVLVVDNEATVGRLLVDALRRRGVTADWVASGEAALERARAAPVAILVCDLDMPAMSGEAVAEAVASWPEPPQTLIMSGFVGEQTSQRLDALGCVVGYLVKPFDIVDFCRQVASLLASARAASKPATGDAPAWPLLPT